MITGCHASKLGSSITIAFVHQTQLSHFTHFRAFLRHQPTTYLLNLMMLEVTHLHLLGRRRRVRGNHGDKGSANRVPGHHLLVVLFHVELVQPVSSGQHGRHAIGRRSGVSRVVGGRHRHQHGWDRTRARHHRRSSGGGRGIGVVR
jgi:hypothetical protein